LQFFFFPCLLKDLASSFYEHGSLDGQHGVSPSAASLPGTNCYKEAFLDKVGLSVSLEIQKLTDYCRTCLSVLPTLFFLPLQRRDLLLGVIGGSSEGMYVCLAAWTRSSTDHFQFFFSRRLARPLFFLWQSD
jgi:hypothetical protein